MNREVPVTGGVASGTRAGDRPLTDGDRPEGDGAAIESGFLHTNGIDTYYERRGDGPPVVFVHGAIMSTTMWETQIEALSDDYTVVAYDVRGHGRTGGSDVESYSMDLYADDLDALLTALGIEKPVLCGLSMGGAIGQAYAVRYPERLSGLVLSDTFTPGTLDRSRSPFPHLEVFARLSPFVGYKRLNAFQLWLGKLFAPKTVGDADTIQRLVDEGPTMSTAEFRKVVRSLGTFARGDLDLSAVAVPTLVMHGEHEPSLFETMAGYMAERIEHAGDVVTIPGAGHASNIDNPAFFTARVEQFLASVYGEEE